MDKPDAYKRSLKSELTSSPYKKGWIEFYKLRFKVTPDVLIPRPETELLVDEVLSFVKVISHQPQAISILDLGTGAGNIAISIAKNLPSYLPTPSVGTRIIAIDISEKALKVAKQNAKLHGVEDKITFIQSDLLLRIKTISSPRLHPKSVRLKNIDIIVTNLPYIPSERIPFLDSSVKDFEPHIALDGGFDGFELYRKLFQQLVRFSLPPQGWKPKLILGEIDYTHGELAVLEAQKYFPDARVEVKTDLAHKQRILLIKQD